MDVGDRIKKRREELGFSAEILGEKIGKAKTSIYRYESGSIEKMPTSVLAQIAKVLLTTPAYLMGWTEEVGDSNNKNPLPDDKGFLEFKQTLIKLGIQDDLQVQLDLLKKISRLNDEQKKLIIQMIDNFKNDGD